ncbi:MAG: ABC transporter ATP-binding protein [Fibrobacterota bacterium]|nr:ABC transporter ATP-binding protein [Fibrobacterota bacterium]QQS06677.1 MAG: ABC transporter ATP-binding protein [Fibrobacterota bacterium]
MSDDSVLLQVEGVGFAYDAGNTAVYGLTLDVRAGEVLLVAGANGSGKTTCLKLLGGFLLPSEGTVRLGKIDLEELPAEKVDEWVAFIRTESEKALVGPTVEDELSRGCRLAGLSGAAIPHRVGQALEVVRLRDSRQWYLDEISVGERRRIALASSLIGKPRVVLMDEPLADLDAAGVRVVGRILRELAKRGLAVVFTSHRLDPALQLTDKVVVLDQGEIVAHGTPQQVLEKPDVLQEAGLTLPPAAELFHRLRSQGVLANAPLPVSLDEAVAELVLRLAR